MASSSAPPEFDFEPISSEAKRVKLTRLSTSEQIQAMKEEIRTNIKFLRDQLDAKECELLDEVDRLGALQIEERADLEEGLKASQHGITLFEGTGLKLNQIKSVTELAVAELEKKIHGISQKLEQYQEMNVSWEIEEFESKIASLCSLSNVTNVESIYQSKSTPKWKVGIGDKSSELSSPTSLAIQQRTDNVFVSDRKGNRIQVYNPSGEHIRMIDKFDGPLNVFYVDDVCMVGLLRSKLIVELNIETLNARTINFPNHKPSNVITVSTISNDFVFFYPTQYVNNSTIHKFFHVRPKTNLLVWGAIPSTDRSQNITLYNATSVDIATDGVNIYLLVSDSDNLIYEFDSEDLSFVRSFCPSSLLSGARSVCVDSRGNILVAGSEGDSTKLLCLSPDGDVIHEFLVPCQSCVSIAVNSKFDISLLCDATNHGLISV